MNRGKIGGMTNSPGRISLIWGDDDDPVLQSLHELHHKVAKLQKDLDIVLEKEIEMGTVQEEVNAAVAGDEQALTALGERVKNIQENLNTTITGLEATITELKAKEIDTASLEEHLANLQAQANAIDAPTAPPAEDTPPVEPAEETPPVEEAPAPVEPPAEG